MVIPTSSCTAATCSPRCWTLARQPAGHAPQRPQGPRTRAGGRGGGGRLLGRLHLPGAGGGRRRRHLVDGPPVHHWRRRAGVLQGRGLPRNRADPGGPRAFRARRRLVGGPKLHLIQYPIRRGELLNQVAVFTSDQYRPGTEDWGTPDELEERFAGKHEYVRAGLRLIGRERRWLLHDREPVGDWTRGRVTLLGDAAHPMLQYLAQGACMALEDAVCLADSMRAYGTDPAKAFLVYQGERIARTSMAQRWARGMGELVHLDGMGALLRDMVLGDRADDDYAHVDWLYGYGATG